MADGQGEFSRGWRIVLGAFVGIGGGFASLYFYSAGLFIKPLAGQFGWTRGEASLGAMAFMVGNVIALPIAGRLVDRFGEVRVAFLSSIGLTAAFVMLGLLTSGLISFLALVLFLTMASSGTTSVSYNRLVVRHFAANRGLALGIALMGTGLGAVLLPPLLAPFIATEGWRAAYLVLAGLTIALSSCAALLLRERKEEHAPVSHSEPLAWRVICGHPAFYSIGAMIFLASSAVLGTTLHIVPMLTDRGMDVAMAGATASALGVAVIGSRVIAGHLLDRWDAGWVSFLLLTLAGLGALLLWTGNPALALSGAALIGFGVGTETDLLAYLLGRRFPVRSFSSVYGAIFAVHALGAGVGGLLAGAIFDMTGTYGTWLLLAAAALLGAGLIAFFTERGIVAARE